jgi:tetratricopeptide (TPR) repeat protein
MRASKRFGLAAVLAAIFAGVGPTVLVAQDDESSQAAEIERLVREGRVETLHSRFRGGRTPEELRLLALAQTNRAMQLRDDHRRQKAFRDAEVRYLTWISSVERDREAERLQRTVNAAAARVAYAGMILSKWAVADLDEFELTAGKRGETRRLLDLLLKARTIYEQAADAVEPLAETLRDADGRRATEVEEHYLALGIYDAIPRLQLDIRFNRAWANLYIGIVDPKNSAGRSAGLRAAERDFQELVDSGQSGETAARCGLGLAMALREQGRYDAARRCFDAALADAGSGTLAAQVRYEQARSDIQAGCFDQARGALRPLVEKDPERLEPADQPARFYINLAHLWEANSYLEEAQKLGRTAESSLARQAIALRATRAREIGLRKMSQLASRGGSWPALVQLFMSDAIDLAADAKTLSAAELLFAARQYSEMKKYRHALMQLEAAAARENVPPDLAAEILFELGVCHYRCRETRAAAEVFERVARDHKSHAKAAQAVSYAYQLWASIADESKRPDDYLHLADVLLNLLQSFPEHEKRDEAVWWLPVALQSGGRYREAIEHFGNVPAYSPQHEEAQYRRALCARLWFDAERSSLKAAQLQIRANLVTAELKSYARQAYQRAGQAPRQHAVYGWSAAALVSAAEVYASAGVEQYQRALDLLDDFEQRYVGSEQIGRVLAVRINGYRVLRRYDDAARVVERFLQTVPPEQAGGTLAVVARGMQEEVDRLERSGDLEQARKLATQSLPTFEQLETWVKADSSRAKYQDAVWYGLARMRYLAGQYEPARELVTTLLAKDDRNGNYQRLNALVLTAALPADAPPEDVARAREAWGAMLRDPALRSVAPERYWEARYHYLELMLRAGEAGAVENAIRQERVWYPELGGRGWEAKLNALYDRAVEQLEATGGASQPSASQPVVIEPPKP